MRMSKADRNIVYQAAEFIETDACIYSCRALYYANTGKNVDDLINRYSNFYEKNTYSSWLPFDVDWINREENKKVRVLALLLFAEVEGDLK